MKHVWLIALLLGCIGLATLAIASEPHNSHPADGDPLLMLNLETEDFSFTEIEVREQTPRRADGWVLKGFLARHGASDRIPFAVVLTHESVKRANEQWNFGDENPNILAALDGGEAITHFDLEPVDAPERTLLIESVNDGMSGQAKWSEDLDRQFIRLVQGTRSGAHAAALLANAFFTHVTHPEQVKREGSEAPSFVTCFEMAEQACAKRRRGDTPARTCVKRFSWSSNGSCSFDCETSTECFEPAAND